MIMSNHSDAERAETGAGNSPSRPCVTMVQTKRSTSRRDRTSTMPLTISTAARPTMHAAAQAFRRPQRYRNARDYASCAGGSR